MTYKISIEELESSSSKEIGFHFEDKIEGINCITPITSDLKIKSLGEFIEITGNVKGIVKLECDLCLKEFEYKIDFDIDEMFAKKLCLTITGRNLNSKKDSL